MRCVYNTCSHLTRSPEACQKLSRDSRVVCIDEVEIDLRNTLTSHREYVSVDVPVICALDNANRCVAPEYLILQISYCGIVFVELLPILESVSIIKSLCQQRPFSSSAFQFVGMSLRKLDLQMVDRGVTVPRYSVILTASGRERRNDNLD